MRGHPPSAVSLFTAVGVAIILVTGVVFLVLQKAAPGYLLLWCVPLIAVVAFNVWASRGR